jgi:hypothetical protein
VLVAADDAVDPRHRLGERDVLGHLLMGQRDDELGAARAQAPNRPRAADSRSSRVS